NDGCVKDCMEKNLDDDVEKDIEDCSKIVTEKCGVVAVYFSILYMRHRAGIVTDEMLTTPKWRFAVIGMLEALGVVTRMYCAGDSLQVKVNKLFFVKSPLPYHYYYLIYCKPKHNQNSVENLGILDNLSVVVLRQRRDESQSTTYEHGLRVGFKGNYVGSKEDKYFINNHLSFRVMYHKDLETDSARIIGFEVTPNSINQEYKEWDEKNP
nr:hypothetical protein [Tanacetum cinerariifolium]